MVEPDVIDICRDLIRINTSNPTHSERPAADYVASYLERFDLLPQIYESQPARSSVMARLRGSNDSLAPLLVHTHLDVVPADDKTWSCDPFVGEVRDGCVWGRGALDMKGMIAAVLATIARMTQENQLPRRDLIFAFFADEEAGGNLGAGFMTSEHPEVFTGCRQAIGEVGGYSVPMPGRPEQRLYLIGAGEKGVHWHKLESLGTAGHGSMMNDDNAIVELSGALARIAAHKFPAKLTATMTRFFEEIARVLSEPGEIENLMRGLGPLGEFVDVMLRNTANPTMVQAGYKVNVIPESAEATVDSRFLPGDGIDAEATLRGLLGQRTTMTTLLHGPALEVPWGVPITESMTAAILAEDPAAQVVPHLSPAFTDAKWLSRLGIMSYGFFPLRLPGTIEFLRLFHGVDERIPVDSLHFCVDVLYRFLASY